jgi:hypothetical protein
VEGGQLVDTMANVTDFFGLLEYFVGLMATEIKMNFGGAISMLKSSLFETKFAELRESISKDLHLLSTFFGFSGAVLIVPGLNDFFPNR